MLRNAPLTSGLIIASLKHFGTYPNDKDELMILRRGYLTSGSISFISLVGIGSNLHFVDLDDLTSSKNSSTLIAINELNFSFGRQQCNP